MFAHNVKQQFSATMWNKMWSTTRLCFSVFTFREYLCVITKNNSLLFTLERNNMENKLLLYLVLNINYVFDLTRLSCSSRGHSRTLSWSLSLSVSHLWKESDPSTPGPHAIKTVSSPSPFFSHGYSWLYWFRKFASPEAKAFQMKTGKFTHYSDFMTSCPNKIFFVFFSKQYDNFVSVWSKDNGIFSWAGWWQSG